MPHALGSDSVHCSSVPFPNVGFYVFDSFPRKANMTSPASTSILSWPATPGAETNRTTGASRRLVKTRSTTSHQRHPMYLQSQRQTPHRRILHSLSRLSTHGHIVSLPRQLRTPALLPVLPPLPLPSLMSATQRRRT